MAAFKLSKIDRLDVSMQLVIQAELMLLLLPHQEPVAIY
jgi:hypothetical protein